MKRDTYTIDADGKSLGRLAAEIAVLLRGKNKADFLPYKDMGGIVTVKNLKKMVITGKKVDQKNYYRHSGFPGGFKETPMKMVLEKKPTEVLRRAVLGMLPKNRLRPEQIKRLKFE
ncbi:MAG: 50S ribosomal protein L13 [Candidatus Nealsonbacteria bacterium]|nr:50S ribosomal protein L13 [Candidatus Nealsonbacteria bacterium]